VSAADEALASELRNCSALEPVTYEDAAAIEKELAKGVLETEQHVMDALTALNTEQLNFFNHRIQEVNKLYSGLAQCRTLPDAAECWTGDASTRVEEYTSHTMKVLELATSLAASEFPGLKK